MPESSKTTRPINFHVTRYNPERDRAPYMQTYTIPVRAGMTVLDGLHYIKENLDASLAWRYSCRMGVCGSCGMLLNGHPTLACNTQILHIATTDLTVGPLPNFEIIRDLVPDLLTMFEKHRSLKPYIVRADEAEINDPQGEFYQSPERTRALSPIQLLHQVRLLHGGLPHLGHRRAVSGAHALGGGAAL